MSFPSARSSSNFISACNSRKVSSSQVAVDADKALIRVSKTLLDSPELQAIRTLDGDIRHFLYDMCLPFEVGIHLLPLGLVETVEEKLREFKDKRGQLVESFLSAYPRLCQEAAGRLRTLYNPADYRPVDEVRSHFTFSWQYVSYGVPEQLRAPIFRLLDRALAHGIPVQVLQFVIGGKAHSHERSACQQPFEYPSRSTQSSAVGQLPEWAFAPKWITSEYATREQSRRWRLTIQGNKRSYRQPHSYAQL